MVNLIISVIGVFYKILVVGRDREPELGAVAPVFVELDVGMVISVAAGEVEDVVFVTGAE